MNTNKHESEGTGISRIDAKETGELRIRVFGGEDLPTLVYLPGLHGDWTLVTSFREEMEGRARFVEVTYPRTLEWSVSDYRDAVAAGLREHGVRAGWLLGESWGSQVAWALLDEQWTAGSGWDGFKAEGLILAGGFVKHPWKWGPGALKWIGEHTPDRMRRMELNIYKWYGRFRHRHAPGTRDALGEFVARRTKLDQHAILWRLELLRENDPRSIARRTRIPVRFLAGAVDPLVPWFQVRWWLRRNCPGYRGGRTFWFADHNVLATAPVKAAELVVRWMEEQPRMGTNGKGNGFADEEAMDMIRGA